MRDRYETEIGKQAQLFTGFSEVLDALEQLNIPWGIVTNKPECYTTPVMQGLNLQPAAGTVICPDHVREKKPHPEALFLACKELKTAPERTVYIGDHRRDIEAGLNAGMPTIAVSYGYLDENENIDNWNSHYRVDHASEIRPILETLFCNR